MTEPLTLAEAKSHLRITHSSEDDYITSLVQASRLQVERDSWRAIVRGSRVATLTDFPPGSDPIYLPSPPLVSVESVVYLDGNGDEQSVEGFRVDATHEPGLIVPAYGESWPETRAGVGAVTITFTAGYADGEVPEDIQHVIRLKLSELYENRSPAVSERRTTYDRMVELIRFRDYRIRGTLLGDVNGLGM
jgi:uncharacterized phiE125 gp8 family phage protein